MLFLTHTYFSLLYGTLSVEALVEKATSHGIKNLVITDINNISGCFPFVKECREHQINPVCGVECRNNDTWLYTCIARNTEGFYEINEFLSEYNISKRDLPPKPPLFNHVFVIYPPANTEPATLHAHEFIGVKPRQANLYGYKFRNFLHKLVAVSVISFADSSEFDLHKHLSAIGHNTLLTMLRQEQMAGNDEFFNSPETVRPFYADFPQMIRNADEILAACSFDFDFKQKKNKKIFTTSLYDDKLLLENLALEGMKYRYGCHNPEAECRVRYELNVINELGYASYFLITWDILRFTMSRGIYHIGRGSGGNSVVAYCLRICDIDPIELNLYFERFINPQRTSPPDFDIDFSWKERDIVHEYIFNKYGNHAALLGTMNTFRDSSVVRELGKVYGLPKNEIDRLVENPTLPALQNDVTAKILKMGVRLMDFPHLRSIHAGGVLISELPMCYYTALDLPPKGLPTTQWDMYVAEEIGLDKLDILSQRGLGHIAECADIVKQNYGVEVDIHQVESFKNDPVINNNLYEGEAIGCFYAESPGMRSLLKKLKCDNYTSLVAASSIIRPGVAKSGMMREYILRFHNQATIKYLHPAFEEHLKETFGIMVYQEDVIKIAHYFAGLSLADADILRRAMSGKYRSKKEFERITHAFFENCKNRGYPDELAAEVWRQMSSFAGYAFCKAHSASYAVESYQSLFLKTYYPREFYTAVINNFGGFYRTWVYVHEAKRHGAVIHLPDINQSNYITCIRGKDLYLGWIHLKSLETKIGHAIVAERERGGPFCSFADFTERIPVPMEQLRILIRAGAFRFTGKNKKELMWSRLMQVREPVTASSGQLFYEEKHEFTLPPLHSDVLEDAYDEIDLLGFPVSLSRFDMLKTSYRGNTTASELLAKTGKVVRMVGDLVTIKYVHTVKKEWMHFGFFIDVNGHFFDTVHFPDSLKNYPFTGPGVYLIEGKAIEEFGYPGVEVKKLARLPYRPNPVMD